MNTLGISCYYHDAAAALVVDGNVVAAAAEERFTRIKHDNSFPQHAIRFCLHWTNLKPEDIDEVVFYEKPVIKFERILMQHLEGFPKSGKIFVENIGSWIQYKLNIPKTLKRVIGYDGPISYLPHHLSHAAVTYYLSPFTEAAIVTVDGVGEWATTTMGNAHGNTIRIDREIHFPHSLGLLYSAITAYLGFEVNDAEYKVMGMAAYGDPKPFRKQFDELITSFADGSYALNMSYFDYVWSDRMYGKKLERLFGYPTRPKESRLEQHYADIAAALQEKLETTMYNLVNASYEKYKTPNLCLSGGVALNSVMNGKLLSHTKFKKIFIPPDPGDGGCAIGAALCRSVQQTKKRNMFSFFPNVGPSFPDDQIEDILKQYNLRYKMYDRSELISYTAKLLTKNKVIGWFQGRMEWGPRALGNRSILASARDEKMKDLINAKIKHRELFRPFAPVVLSPYIKQYFKTDEYLSPSLRYMLMVYPFKPKGKRDVPATAHVDGSGRLQVIERADNPLYYDLIEEYRKLTGIPIILNTSFNVRGEPIVCTPQDAINCFLKTDIDQLVIGPYIISK
jgi:carbamoyltransferase